MAAHTTYHPDVTRFDNVEEIANTLMPLIGKIGEEGATPRKDIQMSIAEGGCIVLHIDGESYAMFGSGRLYLSKY